MCEWLRHSNCVQVNSIDGDREEEEEEEDESTLQALLSHIESPFVVSVCKDSSSLE